MEAIIMVGCLSCLLESPLTFNLSSLTYFRTPRGRSRQEIRRASRQRRLQRHLRPGNPQGNDKRLCASRLLGEGLRKPALLHLRIQIRRQRGTQPVRLEPARKFKLWKFAGFSGPQGRRREDPPLSVVRSGGLQQMLVESESGETSGGFWGGFLLS
jgi:hypothetical protein